MVIREVGIISNFHSKTHLYYREDILQIVRCLFCGFCHNMLNSVEKSRIIFIEFCLCKCVEEERMNLEQMKSYLEGTYEIREERETANAKQLKLENGVVINVFNNGNYNVQGKNNVEVKNYIESRMEDKRETHRNKKVFIVYGHDENARNELESILRRWGLEPVILDTMASGGKTIIEKLESQMPEIGYGIVLATADDEGYKKGAENEKMFRCRQNVVLELGMLLSKLGRDRIAILLQRPEKTERPSDIQGLLYIPFEDKLQPEASKVLAREVEHKLGIVIPASKL